MSDSTAFDIGHQFDLHFAWAPSSGMVRATYRAEIERYEPKGDRVQCKLIELLEARGVQADSELSPAMISNLIGQHVLVPHEALDGIILRLKMSTLTGGLKRPYFFKL